jgi:anaerobic selenocysteine-containing dehydrogenase
MFRNETGAAADVLLPATSWLERWDVAASTVPLQTGRLVQAAGPVMPPRGEARNDARILADLALALGHRGLGWRLARFDFDRWLPRPRYGFRGMAMRPGHYLRRHGIRLWAPELDAEVARLRAVPMPGDGYHLICRRRRLGHNSWLQGATRDGDPEAVAWMRTDDLAALGISDGGTIPIRTDTGALEIPVVAVDGLAPRTVCVPHGIPGLNINDVIPAGAAAIERLSGQLRMTGIAAEVQAAVSTRRRTG